MPPIESLRGMPIVSLAGPSLPPRSTLSATLAPAAQASTTTTVSNPVTCTPLAEITTVTAGLTTVTSTQANAAMLNLLPSMGHSKGASLSAGIYVGEGLLPVPAKLAEKITQWEFVEMAELLPEFWSSLVSKESTPTPAPRQGASRRKRAVTDIATWIQCFATYISVMSTPHPQAVPELLAYLIFILRASQDFGGVAWVTYDAAFRRQAFITGNQQWSKVNPSLYSICFSGAARTGVRCELCLSLSHPTGECTLVCDPDPDISTRLKTLESAVLAFTSRSPQQGAPLAKLPDICRNWNVGRCRMPQCRYRHACRVCGGPNPAFACCDRPLGPRSNPNLHPLGPLPPGEPRGGMAHLQPTRPPTSYRRLGPGPADRSGRAHPSPQPY